MPGALPVLNEAVVDLATAVALALNASIADKAGFARKNYFYPDLPKGYQITQHAEPLARDGHLDIELEGRILRVGIHQIHIEEDAGKSVHSEHSGSGSSLIDMNRCGVPLVEIVTHPDLRDIDEADAFLNELRRILVCLGVTTGEMHEGSLRFDTNISVRPRGATEMGARTEIKNLNSFKAVEAGIETEIERQRDELESGGTIVQVTNLWDAREKKLVMMRRKEGAHDYRYFPEPDLPPLHVEPTWVAQIQSELPELPLEKSRRFVTEYGLTAYAAGVLTTERSIGDYFEAAVESAPKVPPVKIANWLSSDLFGLLNQAGIDFQDNAVPPVDLARLVELVETGEVNATSAKTVLAEMVSSGKPPDDIVRSLGLSMIQDPEVIEGIVRRVLDAHPLQVADYLGGNTGVFQWLFGQVMKEAEGRANPSAVRSALSAALE